MKKVYIYDKSCCHANAIQELASSIRERFAEGTEVKVFDLNKKDRSIPIPRSLFMKMQTDGGKCLPAIVVDNSIVALGKLPKLEEAIEAIRSGKPIKTSQDCACASEQSCC
jgi:hypothetical protein